MFGARLLEAIRHKETPLCVGLDPRADSLPEPFQSELESGSPLRRAQAVGRFCRGVLDVVSPLVAVIKPQVAFFECLGPAGWAVFQEVVHDARSRGLIVIVDAKRNDIGSTAEGYAQAYLDGEGSPFACDALTVNPYLGEDSLRPFAQAAARSSAGIFVLVKTSNPGSGQFQDVAVEGSPLYTRVARLVESLTEGFGISHGYGLVGGVVGATYPEQLAELRDLMPHCWLLIPGYGAQGGTPRQLAAGFRADGSGAVVNSSRGILFAHSQARYAQRFPVRDWQRAVEEAARDAIAELASETPAGHLRVSG